MNPASSTFNPLLPRVIYKPYGYYKNIVRCNNSIYNILEPHLLEPTTIPDNSFVSNLTRALKITLISGISWSYTSALVIWRATVKLDWRVKVIVLPVSYYVFGRKPTGYILSMFCLSYIPSNNHSWLTEITSDKPTDVRQHFNIGSIVAQPSSKTHSHPVSAAERTAVEHALKMQAKNHGYEPYLVSMSSRDQTDGSLGIRQFYWDKDLKCTYQRDAIPDNACIIMIDVDYYVDINDWLIYNKPILIYTVAPKYTTYRGSDFYYNIEDNKINYVVNGSGTPYSHEIWDYDRDSCSILNHMGELTTFQIEQQALNGKVLGKKIIKITPLRKVHKLFTDLKPQPIKRKTYTFGEECPNRIISPSLLWNSIEKPNTCNIIIDPVIDHVSISDNPGITSINMNLSTFEALTCDKYQVGTIELTLKDNFKKQNPTIEKVPTFGLEAKILHKLLQRVFKYKFNHTTTSKLHIIQPTYSALGPLNNIEDKLSGQVITMQLATHSSLVPINNINNSNASIKGRLTDQRNTTIPPPHYGRYANEFVDYIVGPYKNRGTRCTIEEVLQKQNKPMQKARSELAKPSLTSQPTSGLSTMIKIEPMQSVNHPRNITTFKAPLTIIMSTLTYGFKKECLIDKPWYGPCKPPSEVVTMLQEIVRNGCIETDYTRFDGTISEWLQKNIVKAMYSRWASDEDRQVFFHCWNQVFKQIGITAFGELYDSYYGTRSGSPTTTDGNTAINAFIVYVALRELGCTHEQAIALLGIYAGDDGISRLIPGLSSKLEEVAIKFGLKLKSIERTPGEEFCYLGRIFPNILQTTTSYQDLERTLPKLHISINKQVTRDVAAANKALGYQTTDALTPIVGVWCETVLDKCKPDRNKMLAEEIFKLELGAWPQNDQDVEMMKASIMNRLGVSSDDIINIEKDIKQHCFDYIISAYAWQNQREHKIDAIVEGHLLTVGPSTDTNENQKLCHNKVKQRRSPQREHQTSDHGQWACSSRTHQAPRMRSSNCKQRFGSLPSDLNQLTTVNTSLFTQSKGSVTQSSNSRRPSPGRSLNSRNMNSMNSELKSSGRSPSNSRLPVKTSRPQQQPLNNEPKKRYRKSKHSQESTRS
ncbi:MAG: nodavirus polyprotein (domains: methyltransferase, RdRP) [Koper noda-like virus 4]|nr:MAG: nodavirus polyprotein (domains: methyltransferase, RdRP) [Koper noda-like virus 4]